VWQTDGQTGERTNIQADRQPQTIAFGEALSRDKDGFSWSTEDYSVHRGSLFFINSAANRATLCALGWNCPTLHATVTDYFRVFHITMKAITEPLYRPTPTFPNPTNAFFCTLTWLPVSPVYTTISFRFFIFPLVLWLQPKRLLGFRQILILS